MPPVVKSQPMETQELDDENKLYESAAKSTIGRKPKAFLVTMCATRLRRELQKGRGEYEEG